MRNNVGFPSLFCVGLIFIPSVSCAAHVISQHVFGGTVNLYEHAIIDSTAEIVDAAINVNKSLFLNNSGVVDAPVNICSNCVLYFQNNGRFSGTFNFNAGSKLVHVISRPDEFGNLATDRIDGLMIYNASRVSMSDIAELGSGDLIFSNSSIVLDTLDLSFISSLDLRGDVLVYVDKDFKVSDEPLLENVSGGGTLHIVSDVSDDLMGFKTYIVEDKLYVKLERETDYAKIFRDSTGMFLNNLRSSNMDDKLFRALDNAPNMSALQDVMSKSVRLNPIKLMAVPRIVDRLETSLFTGYDFKTHAGPFYITNSDFSLYGVRAGWAGRASESLSLGMATYIGVGNYDDALNEYSFMEYGANLRARYDIWDKYFVRGLLGLSRSEFDIGSVKGKNDDVEINPDGVNIYSALDTGIDVRLGKYWIVSPFVGMTANRVNIARYSDNEFVPRMGVGASYWFEMAGIRYDYDIHAIAYSSLDFDVGVAMHFLSVLDKLGGGFSLSLARDEILGISYKASIGTTIKF